MSSSKSGQPLPSASEEGFLRWNSTFKRDMARPWQSGESGGQ
ncbi:hypothetical protein ABDX87_03555 [Pseudomonas abietaniphila]